MIISLQANLTKEQAFILAKEKGYTETISNTINRISGDIITEELPNPELPEEFLKRVYENLLIEDATKCFIAYDDRKNQALWLENEKAINDSVIASISSTIG